MRSSIGHLRKCLLLIATAVSLAACSTSEFFDDQYRAEASLNTTTGIGLTVSQLPRPANPIDVAVYAFPDQTGQQKPADNFSRFSNAVTQGGSAVLIDVLSNSDWFNVIERAGVQNLLNERALIDQTVAAYGTSSRSPLPPLRFAGILLEGGIIDYDSNVVTGGAGARFLGIGTNMEHRKDRLTVALRAVSVNTGEVLTSVMTEKTVYSVLAQGSVYRFVSVDELLELEAGVTRNEPVGLAVRQAIELAVFALIMEGVQEGLWEFQNAQQQQRLLAAYQRAYVNRRPSVAATPDRSARASSSGRPAQEERVKEGEV